MKDSEATTEASILDSQRIQSIQQLEQKSSAGLLRDLVATFREESSAALEALEGFSRVKDLEGMRKSAHLLASMSAALGAVRFCGLAQGLEKWAAENGGAGEAPSVLQLREERDVALNALRATLGEAS